MEGWEGVVLLATWFQWLCTKLIFFFNPFFKVSLKSSCSSLMHSLLFFFFLHCQLEPQKKDLNLL